ncbi:MAG TPA: M13-type metalloendopeptidase [Rhizomicrobium sp.]|nr:M13-type metalloendopeptidase [Rhizomicrobium sp.]
MKALHILAAALLAATTALADDAKPQYGSWGFDMAGMDTATKPGDDFFRHANGAWLDKAVIPADKPAVTLRLEMTDRTEARLHEIMEAASKKPPTDLEGKVGAFYAAFMDEAKVNALGAAPIAPELDAVRAAKARDALASLMGRSNSDFEGTLFGFYVDVDLKDPSRYAVYLGQSGLGLPDRDYYLQPQFAPQKAKYEAYVAELLHLVNHKNADAEAKDVVAFETKIADASWTKVQDRDLVALYNPMTPAELEKFAPGFDWKGLLTEAGLGKVDRVIVAEKSAFPKLAAIYAATPVDTIMAWHDFHIADNAAPYLSKPFTDAYFDMHDKTLAGQKEQKARWKRAIFSVGGGDFQVGDRFGTFGTMGFGVGQLYSAKYFPPQAKAKIEALVADLKAAYHARIEKLGWMSDATKKEALKKLDTYTIKVGYPDHPRDYSKLEIKQDDLVGDVRRAGALDWAFYRDRYWGPVDRGDWGMTPQTNDAYNGLLRDIVFPAGILQAPVFDPAADPAINYGAVGGIIGHEMTHGFDDEGRKIDAGGLLRDWWTKEDAEKFEARAKMLGAQYSSYEPIPGAHVNGDLTMGENIADLGGALIALDAYHRSLAGKPAPVLDGLNGDQRFFLSNAQSWRTKSTEDSIRKLVVSNPHAPEQYRVNGVVRNMDAWYAAFDIKPTDAMYVAPDQRVRIW